MAGLKGKRLPRPFQRPSIDLDRSGPKREWRVVPWDDIYPGDLVPDEGLVESREDLGGFIYHKTARSHKSTPSQETLSAEGQDPHMFDVLAFVRVSG